MLVGLIASWASCTFSVFLPFLTTPTYFLPKFSSIYLKVSFINTGESLVESVRIYVIKPRVSLPKSTPS